MASCATLRTWLADAETALHKLQTGGKVQQLRHGEKHLNYTPALVNDLQKYVARLQQQVDACDGTRQYRRSVLGIIPVDSNGC